MISRKGGKGFSGACRVLGGVQQFVLMTNYIGDCIHPTGKPPISVRAVASDIINTVIALFFSYPLPWLVLPPSYYWCTVQSLRHPLHARLVHAVCDNYYSNDCDSGTLYVAPDLLITAEKSEDCKGLSS